MRSFLPLPVHENVSADVWRQGLGISIEDKGPLHILPSPVASFEAQNRSLISKRSCSVAVLQELGVLPDYLLEGLRKSNIIAPMPIQSQAGERHSMAAWHCSL